MTGSKAGVGIRGSLINNRPVKTSAGPFAVAAVWSGLYSIGRVDCKFMPQSFSNHLSSARTNWTLMSKGEGKGGRGKRKEKSKKR